ncbi:hypothetical protein [Streptomyces sp. AHA2]|uniref:hypothetical protein n=1 Tax=Streptomyces sp. AHA2 TaxID=3064526 RepID=UPI002FE00598
MPAEVSADVPARHRPAVPRAGSIGAGYVLRRCRALTPVPLRREQDDVPGRPALSTAA